MARKPKTPLGTDEERARVVAVILAHAADGTWTSMTMDQIAEESGITRPRLMRHLPIKQAALALIAADVDYRVLLDTEADPIDLESEPKDRLFDLLMRRFDTSQDMRDGLVPLLKTSLRNPSAVPCILARATKSMRLMLELAGISVSGPLGLIRVKGLLFVYTQCVRVWLDDNSPDMSITMSALDRGLSRGEQVMQRCSGNGGRWPFSRRRSADQESEEADAT